MGRGFDAYVKAEGVTVHKKARPCTTCNLKPELRSELEALRQRFPPVPFPILSQYLQSEHKIAIQTSTLQKHFAAHVKASK